MCYCDILGQMCAFYCEKIKQNFLKSDLIKQINHLTREKKLHLEIETGKSIIPGINAYYLSLEIKDSNNNLCKTHEGGLSIATPLIWIDKKMRFSFHDWQNEEFLDELLWLINNS